MILKVFFVISDAYAVSFCLVSVPTSGVIVFDTVSNSIDTLRYRRVSILIFVVSILSIPPIWHRLAPKWTYFFIFWSSASFWKRQMFGAPYLLSLWRQRYACTQFFVGNLILYNFRLKQFLIVTKVSIPVSILLIFYLKVSIPNFFDALTPLVPTTLTALPPGVILCMYHIERYYHWYRKNIPKRLPSESDLIEA